MGMILQVVNCCIEGMAYPTPVIWGLCSYPVVCSGDSWMYPDPNVPRHGKSLYKPYKVGYLNVIIPKNPKVEHNNYHGAHTYVNGVPTRPNVPWKVRFRSWPHQGPSCIGGRQTRLSCCRRERLWFFLLIVFLEGWSWLVNQAPLGHVSPPELRV